LDFVLSARTSLQLCIPMADQKSLPSAEFPRSPAGASTSMLINPGGDEGLAWPWQGPSHNVQRLGRISRWEGAFLMSARWITCAFCIAINKARRDVPCKRQFSCGRNCPPRAIKNIS